jgi:segregation and condensation protein A
MEQTPYHVQLVDIFEGPMDLLVHLVKKNDIDIYDIPMAVITEQYLGWLELMQELSLDVSGDFLVMASTLMHIKSRMLIPADQDDEEDEDIEDPRMELVKPLVEYLQLKSAAEKLSQLTLLHRDTFVRDARDDTIDVDGTFKVLRPVGLFELIDAFQRILKDVSQEHLVDITKEAISVRQRISELMEILEGRKSITFQELFGGQHTKQMLIVTFLAILEMIKLRLIRAMQHSDSGVLRIYVRQS